MILIKN